jgi:hypothetical protein
MVEGSTLNFGFGLKQGGFEIIRRWREELFISLSAEYRAA